MHFGCRGLRAMNGRARQLWPAAQTGSSTGRTFRPFHRSAEDALAAHWLVYQQQGFGYDAVMSLSTDGGASWREPFLLHVDGTDTEHGFVTLFPWQDGLSRGMA